MVGCNVDYLTTSTLLNHDRYNRTTEQVFTLEISANNLVVILDRFVEIIIRNTGAPNACVIDQNIDATKFLNGTVDYYPNMSRV